MSEVDQTLYALFAQCCAAGLPLSCGLFANGVTTKHELIAMLRAQHKDWLGKLGKLDEASHEPSPQP